jgi:hypothetical protein
MILISAVVLLAACGSTKSDGAVGGTGDSPPTTIVTTAGTGTATSVNGSDDTSKVDTSKVDTSTVDTSTVDTSTVDTITVENFGDMPKECIDLLGTFLKKIEPTVSAIDWEKATYGDFVEFGKKFQPESDAFDAQSEAAGCNKYNLSGSDDKQFQQMSELATAQAPGTVGFLKFLNALSTSAKATDGSIPTDCAGTIAAIEPILAKGGTIKDLTMVEFTTFGQLVAGVNKNCTSDEATAFFARDDVTAFVKT